MHLNIQSITNKSQALQYLAEKHDVDILCLSEHWMREINENLYNLKGYRWSSKYIRQQHIHGGVGILCKSNLVTIPVDGINKLAQEIHFEVAAIYMSTLNTIVICPLGNFETFITLLEQVLNNILTDFPNNVNCIFCGDFNVEFTLGSKNGQHIVNTMRSMNLP